MKHYLARIEKASFEDNKSTLQISVDENILEELQRYKTTVIEIAIADNRTITPEQRGKIYATLRDISNHTKFTQKERVSYPRLKSRTCLN